MMKVRIDMRISIIILICIFFNTTVLAQSSNTDKNGDFQKHTISPGLVMTGYQGWFNTPGDGEERGWHHYERRGKFEPGYCTIDLWPDMSEYEKQYETAFRFEDGTPSTVFSPADESTVRLHFKWMKDYGIDGVFMQRFISEIRYETGMKHFTRVLELASKAALENDRTVAVMYDLSGITSNEVDIVIEDWKNLLKKFGFGNRSKYSNYLFCNNRPLVAIWGVGFNDVRKYNLNDIEKLVKFMKSDEGGNCSVLLGVPTFWREFGRDCIKDEKLHEVIKMVDVVHPWFVGRFREESYDDFKSLIGEDKKSCDENGLEYMPVVFPGFSWNNMLRPGSPSSTIPRNSGNFFLETVERGCSPRRRNDLHCHV